MSTPQRGLSSVLVSPLEPLCTKEVDEKIAKRKSRINHDPGAKFKRLGICVLFVGLIFAAIFGAQALGWFI